VSCNANYTCQTILNFRKEKYFISANKRTPFMRETADNNGAEWNKEKVLEKMLCAVLISVEIR
jgi:hypothetical protein